MKIRIMVNGEEYEVEVEELPSGKFRVQFGGKSYDVSAEGINLGFVSLSGSVRVGLGGSGGAGSASAPAPAPTPAPTPAPVSSQPPALGGGGEVVTAPMPGKVLKILVKVGDTVKTGQGLLILEAMKMENEIPAPKNGKITKIHVKENQTVNTGDPLIEIG